MSGFRRGIISVCLNDNGSGDGNGDGGYATVAIYNQLDKRVAWYINGSLYTVIYPGYTETAQVDILNHWLTFIELEDSDTDPGSINLSSGRRYAWKLFTSDWGDMYYDERDSAMEPYEWGFRLPLSAEQTLDLIVNDMGMEYL